MKGKMEKLYDETRIRNVIMDISRIPKDVANINVDYDFKGVLTNQLNTNYLIQSPLE